MHELDQLFIRACKSPKPMLRIRTYYHRFYVAEFDEHEEYYISELCLEFAQKFNVITMLQLGHRLNRKNYWKTGIESTDSHQVACTKVIIDAVRSTPNSVFKGLKIPIAQRRKTMVQT